MAERQRFELWVGYKPTTVFKTAALNHSATLPTLRGAEAPSPSLYGSADRGVNPRRAQAREPNRMIAAPIRQRAPPVRSKRSGRTPSTAASQPIEATI